MRTPTKHSDRIFPWAVLGLLLLTFGLLSPWLGFYFDDWPVITNLKLRPLNTFWDFHWEDRPVAAWTYIVSGPLVGLRPIAWQFFSIAMRWLSVLSVWWLVRALWPSRRQEAAWIACLFAIFPAFDQQAISVAYSQHWMIYAIFAVSMATMLQAERDPRRFWIWTSMALGAMLVHIFSMEYFTGLELLRPVFLLLIIAETEPEWKKRLIYALKRWLPYLAILLIFVFWRLRIYPQTRIDPNDPEILFGLFNQPLSTLVTLAQYAVQDFLNITAGAWFKTLDPSTYILNDRLVLVSLAVALIAGVGIFYLLKSMYHEEEGPDTGTGTGDSAWLRQAIPLGVAAILLGIFPVWLTGRQTTFGLYGSRFSLAGMLGASLFTVSLLAWMTPRRLTRILLLSVLVALAVGFHVRRVEIFNRSWVKQSRFYWQLFWRAPELETGTAIAADGEMFLYVGRYSTVLTLNLLYPENLPYPNIGHVFYELPANVDRKASELAEGQPIRWGFRNFIFNGSTRDTLLVFYEPEQGNCLWAVDPSDKDNPDLSALASEGVEISNLEGIKRLPDPGNGPPLEIFGQEPEHTWCYFFQKADLARQFGDWQEVANLGDQAQELGFSPNNPQEWLPFIEGYAQVGRWEEAIEKSLELRRINFRANPRQCRLWQRVASQQPVPDTTQDAYQALLNRLECSFQ